MIHYFAFQAAFKDFDWKYPLKLTSLCKQASNEGMFIQHNNNDDRRLNMKKLRDPRRHFRISSVQMFIPSTFGKF